MAGRELAKPPAMLYNCGRLRRGFDIVRGGTVIHAVVRWYSGPGASELFDELAQKHEEVEQALRGVPGLATYTLVRIGDGGLSVTVCRDKAGTDESIRVAADFIRQNITATASPPQVSEGTVIAHVG
jgi:hypothetical protein